MASSTDQTTSAFCNDLINIILDGAIHNAVANPGIDGSHFAVSALVVKDNFLTHVYHRVLT